MIAVRLARPDDAEAIAGVYAPYVTDGTISFEAEPPDRAEMARRMGGELYPWMVAEMGGAVAGYAYASPFRARTAYAWAVETTVYVAAAYHGRGVGRALYAALVRLLTAQRFTQAVGVIALPNAASVALHEALGFVPVGVNEALGWKAGRWIDVGLWQRGLAAAAEPPAPPLPFSAVLDRPGAPAGIGSRRP